MEDPLPMSVRAGVWPARPALGRAARPHQLSNALTIFLRLFLLAIAGVGLTLPSRTNAAPASTNKPAVVKVSGFGLLENREMRRLLRSFQTNQAFPTIVGRDFVEDAALMLLSRVNQDGYLDAKLVAHFTLVDGTKQTFTWTNVLDAQLPRDFAARQARFQVRPGRRFFYQSVEFEGGQAISAREAGRYFIGSDTLLSVRATRVYTPARLRSALAALQEVLRRKGYRDAKATAHDLRINQKKGAVQVKVRLEE